jgi:hypothetical protein
MKIAYFINTFKSINWGGQATSNGIKYMLSIEYPNAEFVPIDLPDLPFAKVRILRNYYEWKLRNAILKDDKHIVIKMLKKMNIEENFFDDFTHVCFNGEGAVHYTSGHLIRFMGLLYLAKKKGKVVASINQTIDLNSQVNLERLVSKVYNLCDFVSVREPLSFDVAKKIGINKVELIPDAVYGLPAVEKKEIDEITAKYGLSKQYITITGSSKLKRNKSSILKTEKIINALQNVFKDTNLVYMANAKTDIYIAHKLQKKYNLIVLESPRINYYEAMAIIANSLILAGGRQHPNIFAYIYQVPYLAFEGNTFKNSGVALLQNYPHKPLSFDASKNDIINELEKMKNDKIQFNKIKINNFKIFG